MLPLKGVPLPGTYFVRFTRIYNTGPATTDETAPFTVSFKTWDAAAGTYQTLLAQKTGTPAGLGDGGAYLTGFIMAELAVVMLGRNSSISPWFTAMIMAYPIFETLFTIFRRLRTKNSSLLPDASHFHHLIYLKVLRAKQFNDPKKLMQLNNRVALLLLLPAMLAAILACTFWNSTTILMPLTLAGCVIYALTYRKLLSIPD